MLLIVSGDVPVFVTVTACAPLVTFGALLKASELGDTVAVGLTPVPLNATDCGLVGSESTKVTAALRTPTAVGRNLTLMVQIRPARRLVPQVLLLNVKSPGFAPVSVMLVIARFEVLTLLSVSV